MSTLNKKPENELLLYIWIIITFSILTLIVATSCSPEYHLGKFKKKGGKIECKGDTVQIEKIVKDIHGKDSLIYVPITEYVPQIEYKTKWQTRFDNKRFKDSLDFIKKQNKINQKTLIKEIEALKKSNDKDLKALKIRLKSEQKKNRSSVFWTWIGKRWFWIAIIGFILGGLVVFRLKR
jgi:hypothetical protein